MAADRFPLHTDPYVLSFVVLSVDEARRGVEERLISAVQECSNIYMYDRSHAFYYDSVRRKTPERRFVETVNKSD
jgi:hypothetical protein